MKKRLALAIVLVLVLGSGAFSFDNEPVGWEDLKWGDAPTEDMVEEELGAWVDIVELRRYKIGETYLDRALSETSYCFWQDKLTMVIWDIFSTEEHKFLEVFLRERHGEPTDTREDAIMWESDETEIILFYDSIEQGGFLLLASQKLLEEATKERN